MHDYTLVTGGAGGIGMALVRRLEQDGHRVIVVDRTEPGAGCGSVFELVDIADGARASAALARPEDVAEAVAFFPGERTGYIAGQLLFVCGGLSLGTNPAA